MFNDVTARVRQLLRENIADPADRGDDYTDSFTAVGSTDFTLTNKLIKNTKVVTNEGDLQLEFRDYNIIYDDPSNVSSYPIIRFNTAPTTDNTVSIGYHAGATWIYPGNPEVNFASPRISIMNITANENTYGLGERKDASTKGILTTSWFQVDIYTKLGKTFTIDGNYYGGGKLLDYLAEEVLKTLGGNKWRLKEQGVGEVKMTMGKDLAYSESTNTFRKLLDFEIEYNMDW